jgi:MscS family membrane protein
VALRRAAGIVLACLTARWFLETVELAPHPLHLALLALDSTLILGLVLLAIALWDAVCDRVAQRAVNNDRAERLLVPVTRKMVRMVILFAGVFVVLGVYGVNVTGLIAGLGIGGLAMALAAKDSVENVFGSLTILFDMPFAIGDWVKIDKVEGVVEEINLRSTRIRTFEDTVIMLPNANLIRVGVENFGARRTRRQRISARISYDVDLVGLESYCQAIRDYLESLDYVSKERSIVALEEFSEPSMGLLVQTYFVASSQSEELRYRDDLLRTILKLREVHGVYFSSPVRPPIAHKETKP